MLKLKNFFITKITRLTKAFVKDEKIRTTRAVERARLFRLHLIPCQLWSQTRIKGWKLDHSSNGLKCKEKYFWIDEKISRHRRWNSWNLNYARSPWSYQRPLKERRDECRALFRKSETEFYAAFRKFYCIIFIAIPTFNFTIAQTGINKTRKVLQIKPSIVLWIAKRIVNEFIGLLGILKVKKENLEISMIIYKAFVDLT